MKPKQNQTATQAVMRALAQELVNTSPVTTPRAHIAHHVYALFHQTRGRYASEKTFYKTVKRLACEQITEARAYNNQTPTQRLMCDAARCLIANSEVKTSKRAIAQEVFALFKDCAHGYESAEAFYVIIKRLGRNYGNT